jgi:hypothetical protein
LKRAPAHACGAPPAAAHLLNPPAARKHPSAHPTPPHPTPPHPTPSHLPKGCYDIGLPSGKSLFALQAERVLALQKLAAGANGGRGKPLRWFIMTSPFTHDDTV